VEAPIILDFRCKLKPFIEFASGREIEDRRSDKHT
jgi:hypothetical protein